MVSNNLVPLMMASLAGAIVAGDALNPKQLMVDFNAVRSMPPQYSGGAWVMIFDVQKTLGKEREHDRRLEGLPPEPIRWNLDPRAEHCADSAGHYGCPSLAGEYDNWGALPTVPAGQVTCRGNCRCHLEVFREGQWQRGVYGEESLTKASAGTYHRGNGAHAPINLDYDPAQVRDEDGKWSPVGGGGKTAEDEWAEDVFGDTRPNGKPRQERRSGDSLSERLTERERVSIDDWVVQQHREGGYAHIRDSQKKGVSNEHVEVWENALDQCDPYEGRCFRGGAMDPETASQFRNKTTAELREMTITMAADSSASKERGVADSFIGGRAGEYDPDRIPVRYSIGSSSAADLSSLNATEGEVILRKGTKFRPVQMQSTQLVGEWGMVIMLEEITEGG